MSKLLSILVKAPSNVQPVLPTVLQHQDDAFHEIKTPRRPFNSIKNHFDTFDKKRKLLQSEEIVSSVLSFTSNTSPKILTNFSLISKGWDKTCSKDIYWIEHGSKQAYLKKKKNQKKIISIDNPQEYYPFKIESLTYKEESQDCVVYENNSKVPKEATLNKLVEELTSPVNFDIHFLHTFMITFRSFTNSTDLMDLLIDRFNIPPPLEEDFSKFKSEKLDRIRLRVIQTIRYWIEHFYHFDFDHELKKKLEQTIKMMNSIKGGKIYTQVLIRALSSVAEEKKEGIFSQNYPTIQRTKKGLFIKPQFKSKILNWPSIEIARQICLIDFDCFSRIEPKECLNQSWSKGLREVKAPGITSMIQRFNVLSQWVATEVVQVMDLKERVETIEKFIEIGDCLKELNNLNSLFSICAGLSMASVYRIKKTWENVKTNEKFKELNDIVSSQSSYKNARYRLRNVKPPCIPYIGIYLTDLTFIEDGNPKYVGGKINFYKCQLFAGVIRDLQLYQVTKYFFETCPEISVILKWPKVMNETELYDQSLIIEPKKQK